jgi:hypothetical protein
MYPDETRLLAVLFKGPRVSLPLRTLVLVESRSGVGADPQLGSAPCEAAVREPGCYTGMSWFCLAENLSIHFVYQLFVFVRVCPHVMSHQTDLPATVLWVLQSEATSLALAVFCPRSRAYFFDRNTL